MNVNKHYKEGMHRSYSRKLKKEDLDAQIEKLPNEFRHCLDDYNHNNVGGELHIDENDYGFIGEF